MVKVSSGVVPHRAAFSKLYKFKQYLKMFISLAVKQSRIHPLDGNYVYILLSTDITVISLSEILDCFQRIIASRSKAEAG